MYDLLKTRAAGLKTDLAKARGTGSAHHGAHHWIWQRITAIANVLLLVWFVANGITLIDKSPEYFVFWLSAPKNAIFLSLLVISAYTHAKMGLQIVIEDYVHNVTCKTLELISLNLLYWLAMITTLFSILKIAFGG